MVAVIEETLYLVKPAGNPDFHRLSISVNIILNFKECFSLIVLKGPKRLSLKGNENCTKEQKGCQGKRCEFRCFCMPFWDSGNQMPKMKIQEFNFCKQVVPPGKIWMPASKGAIFCNQLCS